MNIETKQDKPFSHFITAFHTKTNELLALYNCVLSSYGQIYCIINDEMSTQLLHI